METGELPNGIEHIDRERLCGERADCRTQIPFLDEEQTTNSSNMNHTDVAFGDHVEIVAGEHAGDVGWVSETTDGTLQITTGDDKVYAVRRTSVRIMARAVALVPADNVPEVNVGRIEHHLSVMKDVLNKDSVTLAQWQAINQLICEMFEHPDF
jgi:hypothetical protein